MDPPNARRSWVRFGAEASLAFVILAAIGGFLAYSFLGDNGPSPHVERRTADPGVSVTPGHEVEAIQAESARSGMDIKVPAFVPGPATQLRHVVTSTNGVGVPTVFDPRDMPGNDKPPLATLTYGEPGGGSASVLTIKEIVVSHSVAPHPPGMLIDLPAGTPYQLWFERISDNGQPLDHYSFTTSDRRTIIAFTGADLPSQASVIKMYDSMR